MQYNIFGKKVKIMVYDERIELKLKKDLSLYSLSDDQNIDVDISIVDKLQVSECEYISPSIHSTVNNGFIANYSKMCKVLYQKDDILRISVQLFEDNIMKFRTIDYNNMIDSIGELLHELVLVPMMYFFDDRALIHSSAIEKIDEGQVFLIGGTGGMGKTSVELFCCRTGDFAFMADDIAVIDSDGYIYPNLSFPKIYAYNVDNNRVLEKEILSSDALLGRFQWFYKKLRHGKNQVRRRVSPKTLYNEVENSRKQICKYFILTRTNVSKLTVKDITAETAAIASLQVIKNEYNVFHQHVIWHEYNCLLNNLAPIISIDKVFKNMGYTLKSALQNKSNFIIEIPKAINHDDYLHFMYRTMV